MFFKTWIWVSIHKCKPCFGFSNIDLDFEKLIVFLENMSLLFKTQRSDTLSPTLNLKRCTSAQTAVDFKILVCVFELHVFGFQNPKMFCFFSDTEPYLTGTFPLNLMWILKP